MKTAKKLKKVKLKNRYNGDIVVTEHYDEVEESNGIKFIRVYNESNPGRVYSVNKDAYEIV